MWQHGSIRLFLGALGFKAAVFDLNEMVIQSAGFREIEHTADWELHVWAPELTALFEQAARGMYALSGTHLKDGPRMTKSLKLVAADLEGLLVTFLDELLFLGEQEGLGFDCFDDLKLQNYRLSVVLGGAPLASRAKEIKAVTFHNLSIRETDRGYEVNIVFDV